MKRKKVYNKGKDKRYFSKTADRTRSANVKLTQPMRGGYRM